MYTSYLTRSAALVRLGIFTVCAGVVLLPRSSMAEGIIKSTGVIQKISSESDRIELTVNSSRILTLETRIPRVQINNPELLSVTALSATEIQVSAKKAGVTQINLWDEKEKVYSIDVLIYGDVRELEHALKIQFPSSSIRVFRYSSALVLNGVVDRPDHVSPIMRLAEDYSPKVVNNMTVAGAGKIMLNVKIMEVSRTKLRELGFDFAQLSSSGGYVASIMSGLLSSATGQVGIATSGETFSFGIVNGQDAFFGYLNALAQNDLVKILAEPVLVTVSGRPAQFNVGGEIPVLVPQSLGTVSIDYKKYGTQVDFLPIVLGNGNIRLEIRPRVSEVDNSQNVIVEGYTIPGLRTREINTAVEMKAGQTVALAGLIQERTEAQMRGLPIVSNIPWLGVPFRSVREEVNEVELLIVVTPEYIDAMDPCEVPNGYPGTGTDSPSDCELYFGGHLEVPRSRPPCTACGLEPGYDCGPGCNVDPSGMNSSTQLDPSQAPMLDGRSLLPQPGPGDMNGASPPLPEGDQLDGSSAFFPGSNVPRLIPSRRTNTAASPRPYNPNRRPTYVRDTHAQSPGQRVPKIQTTDTMNQELGLIGPIGYDVQTGKSP